MLPLLHKRSFWAKPPLKNTHMFSFTFSCLCSQRIIALILVPEGFLETKSITCLFGLSKCLGLLESASANCFLLTDLHFLSSASYLPLLQVLGCHKETPSHVEELPCQAVWTMQKMHKFSFFFPLPLSLVFKKSWKQHASFKSNKRRKSFSDGAFLPLVVLQAILQLFSRMKIQKVFTLFRDFIHAGLQTMQNYKLMYYWQSCNITSFSSLQAKAS